MVSNQELKERLHETKSGLNRKGYLVCDTCKGSYKLEAGEKPEDYSPECECGGKLTYNRNISSSNKNTRLKNIIIVGSVSFVIAILLASFLVPLLYLGYMESQFSSVNKNVGTSTNYDQLNTITLSYDALQNQYQYLGTSVYSSKNIALKSAYSNAQLQLENTNTTISNANSALSTGQPSSEVNKRINVAQAQLLIAQKSLNNVTSMM